MASRAVDGVTSTDWVDSSCTHTTTTTDPWWRVDLGSPVAVTEVRIVNRACDGDCGSRLSSFEIRIGKLLGVIIIIRIGKLVLECEAMKAN